jgi:hypothetical protein
MGWLNEQLIVEKKNSLDSLKLAYNVTFELGPLETCYPNVMIDVHSPELANEIKQKIQGEVSRAFLFRKDKKNLPFMQNVRRIAFQTTITSHLRQHIWI